VAQCVCALMPHCWTMHPTMSQLLKPVCSSPQIGHGPTARLRHTHHTGARVAALCAADDVARRTGGLVHKPMRDAGGGWYVGGHGAHKEAQGALSSGLRVAAACVGVLCGIMLCACVHLRVVPPLTDTMRRAGRPMGLGIAYARP